MSLMECTPPPRPPVNRHVANGLRAQRDAFDTRWAVHNVDNRARCLCSKAHACAQLERSRSVRVAHASRPSVKRRASCSPTPRVTVASLSTWANSKTDAQRGCAPIATSVAHSIAVPERSVRCGDAPRRVRQRCTLYMFEAFERSGTRHTLCRTNSPQLLPAEGRSRMKRCGYRAARSAGADDAPASS